MKRFLFLISTFAIILSSCRNEEPSSFITDSTTESQTLYMTVEISEPTGPTTREISIQEGLPAENTINSLRFFFFDNSGNIIQLKTPEGQTSNYLEWNEGDSMDDPSAGIEENSSLELKDGRSMMLELKTINKTQTPKWAVAIANSKENAHTTVTTLTELRNITGTYDITESASLQTMSNSVYANADKVAIDANDVSRNIFSDRTLAIENPLDITLERISAKVFVTLAQDLTANGDNLSLPDGSVAYPLPLDNEASLEEAANNKIYVKLLGWNLTCIPSKTFLIKHINPQWANIDVFGTDSYDWNSIAYKRSFWAINPALSFDYEQNGDYHHGDFQHARLNEGFGTDNKTNFIYTRENAAQSDTDPTAHPTKLIVAAQLVDSKGQPLEIAQIGSINYTVEDLLTTLADLAEVYEVSVSEDSNSGDVTTGSGTTTYTKLDSHYFKFISASEAGKDPAAGGRYFSYIQLDPEAVEGKKLSLSAPGEILSEDQINADLLNRLTPVKIWTEGQTYYFVDIQHLNLTDSEGISHVTSGIVRNHIYSIKISSFGSLGIPVFNPHELIIPEEPDDDQNFMATEINTVVWRQTSKNIQLEW